MEWFGRAKTEYTSAPSPRIIKKKDGEETDFIKLLESTVPPCQLNPLLFNGHVQTMWTVTKPHGPSVYYRRKLFQSEDKAYQGTFAVDFVAPPFEDKSPDLPPRTKYYTDEEFNALGSDDTKPMLVVLHGLSGGSHEVYLRHAIAPLTGDGGWEVCVVNSRGCAGSKLTTGVLYNARATWDIRQMVNWLRKTYPNRPLFGLGFSLGANMLTNYCGEEGPNCQLKAAIVCSNPFNLEISSKVMQNRLLSREVYLRYMGGSMKQLVANIKKELEMYTELDIPALEKITYLHEFDRLVQCPTWGYPTEDAYYRDASSIDAILAIRIPFVAIQALDDPIAVKEALPYQEFKQNPNTVLLTTSLGGHLCWFETGGGRWHARAVPNILNEFASNVDLDSIKPAEGDVSEAKHTRPSTYAPMRRKLYIRERE